VMTGQPVPVAPVVRPSPARYERPTSLSLSPLPASVRRPGGRDLAACSWRRGSVDSVLGTSTTTITWRPAPLTPDTDGSLSGGVPHSSCLEDLNADSSSSSGSGSESGDDGTSCLLSGALHRFRSSPVASSLVDDFDPHAELPSPALLSTAPAKPRQRTIDALSKKIRRNQTARTVDEKPSRKAEALASSFAKPDSSCPTPPLPASRPLASSLSSSSSSGGSLSPPDARETPAAAAAGHASPSCKHEVPSNDFNDSSSSNYKDGLSSTLDDSSNTSAKDPMSASRRKRTARRKSQTCRQLPADTVEKVTATLSCHF